MFGKKKNKDVENEVELTEDDLDFDGDDKVIEDNSLEDDFETEEEKEVRSKKEEKEEKKAKKKEELKEINETLDPTPKTRVGTNFRMYKFIIKIFIFAVLIAFAILMFIYKIELIGAVYMITAVIILFSAIIRLIPLLKTTKSKRARLILLIQCLIHITIGAYLILAAFYHWDKWNQLLADDARANTLEELYRMSGGKFAEFNVQAYAYILVIFFYTLAMGYFWVTIEFKENSKSTLFWLNFVSITLAVVIAFLAPQEWFDAEKLVIALAILALFGALVIGGEATGGYIRYRKVIAGDIKKKEKKTEVGKEAPSRKDDTEISDIDPNIIPKDDPRDEDSVVS
ncbi:hypothetical protein EI71_00629 [Anaeroplasma bactoclasticum]|jgi:magnesium-transporting ATPase (P-type)|uniref:Uncharacterized protein n=1 Tax=Anaeroplasma bactoclasticum TaxID=2088 RepID=A0A397RXQ6_9MOLU|nr:hypothetical protein [Anaeroplasma bactoclasticum]RIA78052.1 hypothetical protein EI71_00629 [Anaeroplasma bactoclasticum]